MGVSGYIFPSCAPLPAPPLFSDPVKIYAKRRPKHFYRKKESYVLQCLRNFDIMDKKEEKKDHSRRSIYGGSTVEKIADATGDWRVKKVKGRFWFVDPEGYPFYCMGLCSVRYGKSYGGRQRVQDMFGTLDHWGKKTNGLVSGLGVNCVGPWSAHDVLNKSDERLPYMMMIPFAARFGKELNITKWGGGHVNFDGDVLPIFYPDFPGFAEKLAQYMVSECKSRDDRYCIGYFSDNELPFKQSALNKYIRLEDQNPGKIEALRWMSERGYTPDQATEEKVQIEFLGHVARTYFRICQRALKKAAPGKLYVGCRVNQSRPFLYQFYFLSSLCFSSPTLALSLSFLFSPSPLYLSLPSLSPLPLSSPSLLSLSPLPLSLSLSPPSLLSLSLLSLSPLPLSSPSLFLLSLFLSSLELAPG
ncbi:hypothetical protein AAMO2058_000076100 [Amorphochlora amoebiformis]